MKPSFAILLALTGCTAPQFSPVPGPSPPMPARAVIVTPPNNNHVTYQYNNTWGITVKPARAALTDKPLVHPAVLPLLPPNPVKATLLRRSNTPPAAVQRFAVLPRPQTKPFAWDTVQPAAYTTLGTDGIVTWHTQNIAYVIFKTPTLAPATWVAYTNCVTNFAILPTGPGNGFYSAHSVDLDTGLESP